MQPSQKTLTTTFVSRYEKQMTLNAEQYGQVREGALPTVVLHGWANSLETIKPLSLQLANYTEVHALDLPGHGKSAVPETVWGMREYADAVKGYLDAHGLTRVNLVGHSFGGKTSIVLSALYPEYVERMVLIGASGIRAKPTFKKRVRNFYLKMLRTFIRFRNTAIGARIYRDWYIPRYASRDYLNAGPMTKIFVKTVNEELHAELASISIPTLLLWGEQDDESTPAIGAEMNSLIKGSKFIVLPNQNHFPFLGTSAPLVVKYIRDFLFP